jgi:hypothetical protein
MPGFCNMGFFEGFFVHAPVFKKWPLVFQPQFQAEMDDTTIRMENSSHAQIESKPNPPVLEESGSLFLLSRSFRY